MKIVVYLSIPLLLLGHPSQGQDYMADFEKGIKFGKQVKMDSARYYLQRSIGHLQDNEAWQEYFEAQYYLCLSFVVLDRNDEKCKQCLDENLELAKEKSGPESAGAAEMFFALGWFYDNRIDDDVKALSLYQQSLQIREDVFGVNHYKTAKTYANVSLLLSAAKQLNEAEIHLIKALDSYSAVFEEGHQEYSRLYNTAFIFYNALGEKDKALSYALALKENLAKNPLGGSWALRSLRQLQLAYFNMRLVDSALVYAKKELGLYQQLAGNQPSRLLAEIHNNLGRCYEQKSDTVRALENTQTGLNMKSAVLGEQHPSTLRSAINLANMLAKFDQPNQGIKLFKRTIPLMSTSKQLSNELIRAKSLLATAHNIKKEWDLSLTVSQEAQTLYLQNAPDRPIHDVGFGYYLNSLQQEMSAKYYQVDEGADPKVMLSLIPKIEESVNRMNEIWINLDLDQESLNFLDSYEDFYITCAEIYFQLYRSLGETKYLDQFLYFSEKSKASISLPAFSIAAKKESIGVPLELLQYEKHLKTKIAALEQSNDDVQIEILTSKLAYDSLANHIKNVYPSYHRVKYDPQFATITNIQEILHHDEALISYYDSYYQNLYALIVTKDGTYIRQFNRDAVPDQILALRTSVDNQADLEGASIALYESVWKPLGDIFENKTKIQIIPHGLLHYVPFEILQNPADSSLLINQHIISYDASATLSVQKRKSQKTNNHSMIAFAPTFKDDNISAPIRAGLTNLKWTTQEVENLGRLINLKKLIGKNATKAAFKNELANYDIIHLATHAIANDIDPHASNLSFAQDDQEKDAYLYAYELLDVEINAELVTLSACNTGYGKLQKGEGVMSLSTAFAYAGVPSLLMSLWQVNDQSTSELMVLFYQNLKDGMNKDEALHFAKLSYLENADPVKSHPYYWAGFVISGDSRPMNLNANSRYLTHIIFVLVAIGIYMAWIIYKRK